MMSESVTATSGMSRTVVPPCRKRLSTSRPRASVPNQCAADEPEPGAAAL